MPKAKGAWTPDVVRKRIQAAQLINRLQEHVLGEKEMTVTQIRAAEILLKKAIPDLSSTEFRGIMEHRTVKQLSDEELAAIASGTGVTGQAEGPSESPELH